MRSSFLLAFGVTMAVWPSVASSAVSNVEGGILFSYTDPSASSVALAGQFNDWSTTANPMAGPDGDGTFTIVLPLQPGDYEYKFVVNGSVWTADPDNPRTGGDFGNSLLRILPSGQVDRAGREVIPSGTPEMSNTPLHNRIYLGGFFRMIMEGASDLNDDPRLRLQRPEDQFNLDVTANLTDRLWGTLRLQVETGRGEANELNAELYKAQTNFIDENFGVKAYYNEEIYSSQEPLELLGHRDLRGTIEEEHRPFGQGTQGVLLEAEPANGHLSLLYADTFDEDIFNPSEPSILGATPEGVRIVEKQGLNQSTGTDVLLGRYAHDLGPTTVGVTYRGEFSDWWVNFTKEENEPRFPNELLQHLFADPRLNPDPDNRFDGNVSDNFEIANDFHVGAIDVAFPVISQLDGHVAGAYTWYDASWDLGNREALQGGTLVNGPLDIPIGNEVGWRGEAQLEYKGSAWSARASHELQYAQGMDATENFIAFRTTPGSMISDRSFFADTPALVVYDDVNGSDGVDVVRLGPRPMRVNHITEIDLVYGWREFELGLEVDRRRENLDYEAFFGDGPASLDRTMWRFSPVFAYRPFARADHHVSFESEFLSYSDAEELAQVGADGGLSPLPGQGQGSLLRLDSNEYILKGLVPAGTLRDRNLSLRFDFRFIDYNGRTDLTAMRQDSDGNEVEVPLDLQGDFFSAFVAMVYRPVDAVQVHVGYGVDPRFYGVISPEGWPNGRQQFRDRYLIERRLDPYNPVNVLAAEQELEDRRQFVINAVVTF